MKRQDALMENALNIVLLYGKEDYGMYIPIEDLKSGEVDKDILWLHISNTLKKLKII